jgi:hypothetical protein
MEQFMQPLHLACGDDELRPNMMLIEIKNNIATATNGHLLVKIDLGIAANLNAEQVSALNNKYVHKEVWKEIHKCDSLEIKEEQIDCWKSGIKKTFYFSNANGEFFDTNKLLSENADSVGSKEMVAYNPKFITILQKIFQHESIVFSFADGEKGTFVFPYEDSGMCGLLMPMMLTKERKRYIFW